MDVRQLQFALALAETLHFRRAADQMHIAQSAFSAQIARLERQIGAPLFDRSSNRVTVTPAGEAFLPRARAMLDEVVQASEQARVIHTSGQKQLRVGLFCDSAAELTPLMMSAFRSAMPEVHVVFHELSMVDQIEAVLSEKVDLAFVRTPIAHPHLTLTPLFSEPRFAVVGVHHPLARQTQVTMEELADEAFAVAAPEAPRSWSAFWACDDVRGEPSRVAAHVTTVTESLNVIAYNGAVDTFPGAATRFLHFPGVVYRPLVDGTFSTLALVTRDGDRRVATEVFRHVAQQLVETSLDVVPNAVAACGEDVASA